MDTSFFHSGLFNWILLPVMIFLSRMTDVTLGTLRHIFLAKGVKRLVPVLGFFEVLIWLVVIGQIMKNLNNFLCYLAWAGGFATGTLVGMLIEERLALGMQVIRIITNQECEALVAKFREKNLGITLIDGQGSKGPVKIIFTVIKRKDLESVAALIRQFNPNAFYSIEDIREANQGVFPRSSGGFGYFSRLLPSRK